MCDDKPIHIPGNCPVAVPMVSMTTKITAENIRAFMGDLKEVLQELATELDRQRLIGHYPED